MTSPTPPEAGPDIVKWLELGGIWITAVVALVLPVLYRPRLTLFAKPNGVGSTTYIPLQTAAGPVEELWFRLGVANRSDLNAEAVQARLILSRRRDRPGRSGYNLFSSWWLKVSALSLTEISIPPKYIQYIDLCFLSVDPASGAASLYLAGIRPPLEDWDKEKAAIEREPKLSLDPGVAHDVLLAIAGRNTHASYWRVTVSWRAPARPPGAALYGEESLRGALQIGEPRRINRFVQLEDPEVLSKALGA